VHFLYESAMTCDEARGSGAESEVGSEWYAHTPFSVAKPNAWLNIRR
jgi:hypothetical protein